MIEEKTDFQKQIDDLLVKEKTARMNSDNNESVKILKQIGKLCYELNQFDKLYELVISLCKKRGQPKKGQIELVQQCMGYLKTIESLDERIKLINVIKEVSEKKIYLEVEYARCILLLVKYKEQDNDIVDAAKILQEVQVETYGSMDKREKLEFILYQIKIMIKKLDYTRIFIISKKIEPKNIEDKTIADLKVTYYSFLVFYYRHEGKYSEVANSYGSILETLHNNEVLQKSLPPVIDFNFNVDYNNVLENFILYLSLTKQGDEKAKRLQESKEKYQYQLEQNPHLLNIINSLLSTELISTNLDDYHINQSEMFSPNFEKNAERLKDFRKQLIQHNLRIFQLYFESIYLQRLSQLIKIDVREIEEEICEMIENKLLVCRIDRVSGIAQFKLRQNENQVLDQWGEHINTVLDMIELTSNYIKREEELYM